VKCKGENGEPALLPIRYIEGKAYNRGEGPADEERNLEGKETKLQKEIGRQKEEYTKEKQKKEDDQKDEEIQDEDLNEGSSGKLVEEMEKGIQTPKFSSIYTYKTDYSEFIDDPATRAPPKLPSLFTVEFKVPRMENIAEASTL
jgi:hypothetical protein